MLHFLPANSVEEANLSHLSLIRITGSFVASLFLLYGLLSLRSYNKNRIIIFLIIAFSIGLAFISIFPEILSLPAEFFSLGKVKGGRFITLIILTIFVIILFMVRMRNRLFRNSLIINNLLYNEAKKNFFEINIDKKEKIHQNSIWVIMPVFNEEENLPIVISEIPSHILEIPVHTLVIDDGSNDNSLNVAQSFNVFTTKLPFNCGGGIALHSGFKIAMENRAAIIVTIDGDGQHNPLEMPNLVFEILNNDNDLVIGSRLLGSYEKFSIIRSFGLHFFNKFINILVGTKISDCSSGFRAIRAEKLKMMTLVQEQYHTAEMLIEAAKLKLKIKEVPIHIRKRLTGHSKKGKNAFYGVMFLRTILKTMFR